MMIVMVVTIIPYHLTFPPLKDVLWLLHAVAVQLGSPRLSDLDSFYCQVRLFLGL